MKKLLLLLAFFPLFALEDNMVEIIANKFEMDRPSGITKFIGKVSVKQKKDTILADLVNVYSDKNSKPEKYEAINNVKFEFYSGDSHYKGDSKYLDYFPKTQQYIIRHKATVYELNTNKTLKGDKIIIDRATGKSEVFGNKDPVKFIFDSTK